MPANKTWLEYTFAGKRAEQKNRKKRAHADGSKQAKKDGPESMDPAGAALRLYEPATNSRGATWSEGHGTRPGQEKRGGWRTQALFFVAEPVGITRGHCCGRRWAQKCSFFFFSFLKF